MKRLINSCFGLGRLPIAPGTWGSLPVVAVFVLLQYLSVGTLAGSAVMIVFAVTASVLCVRFAPASIEATGRVDPPEVVLDEFAGQSITFVAASTATADHTWIVAVVGFLLFRFFDIFKPYPARRLEGLPAGWGILADDLAAGVYAAIVLQLYIGFMNNESFFM